MYPEGRCLPWTKSVWGLEDTRVEIAIRSNMVIGRDLVWDMMGFCRLLMKNLYSKISLFSLLYIVNKENCLSKFYLGKLCQNIFYLQVTRDG